MFLPADIARREDGLWFARIGMEFFWGTQEECERFLRNRVRSA